MSAATVGRRGGRPRCYDVRMEFQRCITLHRDPLECIAIRNELLECWHPSEERVEEFKRELALEHRRKYSLDEIFSTHGPHVRR